MPGNVISCISASFLWYSFKKNELLFCHIISKKGVTSVNFSQKCCKDKESKILLQFSQAFLILSVANAGFVLSFQVLLWKGILSQCYFG